ncbi:hypothetical protein ASPZODRAFT_1047396 [Penicilliopsis zonata CBS 506.65]|uniref:Developmental and secondary metabolism regulator veA n=1 Tax=Penicilliopsis zonata CBS 506.65 TaxID=1073090 RepID=A0A1L9SRM0_9EURO|nr:hypothetical protein ASPZODRAFT_1047396 [Penicilliopsis zonata CBS 506.65]OJJ49862.1 hypothetical protein ASPZODRAFT_1047396 [Penicilliopsis zonata CBS 506.65]
MTTRMPLMDPANQTRNSASRVTREGKKLTYTLTVMQQPERARACGSGAKSSADRRPVDPPPVVELRIHQSEVNDTDQGTDITFQYNANFFLYATLELARPIAHGRVAGSPQTPVLTGVPVAGVAYLDRPSPAGYFIFPDLSVRNEGRYRLNFHLYEEVKDPKDADPNYPLSTAANANPGKPAAPQNHMHFRVDVKSLAFNVYSAKKFPGLATSTSLSRIIAEQGCRVRIRRDVRMRRRSDKQAGAAGGDDYDYEDDQHALAARSLATDRYPTPEGFPVKSVIDRPRSTSNSSVVEPPPFAAQRRPSAAPGEYGGYPQQPPVAYQRAPPAPPTPTPPPTHHAAPPPSAPPAYQSHLSFGASQSQY